MELTDISRRILGQHWRLIGLCVVIAVAAVVLVVPHGRTYTASARLVMDAPDPQTNAETTGVADTVSAIATSPSAIAAALRDAGIKHRDPLTVANAVTASSLGQSSVVNLSVSDPNPHVAAALANALGAEVIRARLEVTRGSASRAMAQLDHQISSINQRIAGLDTHIDQLTISLAGAGSAAQVNTLRAQQNEELRQRDLLDQSRASFESQRTSLLSTNALQRSPSIISAATMPATSNASGTKTDLVLGVFLGLIIGIAIAGILETARPQLVGSDAIASEFHAPILGTLSTEPANASPAELEPMALRVRLAAKAAGLPNIRLVAVREESDVSAFAQWLDETWSVSDEQVPARQPAVKTATQARRRTSASTPKTAEVPYRIRAFDPQTVLLNGAHIGIVVVSPDRVAKSELSDTMHLLRVTPGSVLGVVTYRQPTRVGLWDRFRSGYRDGLQA